MPIMQHLAYRHPAKTLFTLAWVVIAILCALFGAPTMGA